jgi:hypothetical protein
MGIAALDELRVVEWMPIRMTRYHAVRIALRIFGTKGSQVKILSPRPSEGPGITGFGLWSGLFTFPVSASPRHRRAIRR